MANDKYTLYCCGSRGSWPVEGHAFNEFGGHTTCYVLKKKDYALVIDCGTGFYTAVSLFKSCKKVDIFLTHMHYDHILGLLKWTSIPKDVELTFYTSTELWSGNTSFNLFFAEPFWPVRPNLLLKAVPSYGVPLKVEDNTYVHYYKADHPNKGSLIIVNYDNNKLVMMGDNESPNSLSIDLIKNCNILIYDGMYTDEEYETRKGYGHSTWHEGVKLAQKVNPNRLIITHHNPSHEDRQLLEYEKQAREIYPWTDFARAGQNWTFPLKKEEIEQKDNNEVTYSQDIKSLYTKIVSVFDQLVHDEKLLRERIQTYVYVLLGFVSLFMTIVNFFTGEKILMIATLAFSILSFIDVLLVKAIHSKNGFVSILFIIEGIVLCTFFIISGKPDGFSIIWSLLLPTAGMLVFGNNKTIISSTVLLIIIFFLLYTPIGNSLLMYEYNSAFRLRFLFAYIAFFSIAIILDFVRTRTVKVLNDNKRKQEEQIATQTQVLRDQNYELSSINAQLEMRNRLLNKTFGGNLPDDIVQRYLDDSSNNGIGGVELNAALLRIKIDNYVEKTSNVKVEERVKALNNYLSRMLEIIFNNKGMVVEYKESGIFAYFSEGNYVDLAICSAIEIQKYLKNNNYLNLDIEYCIHAGNIILGTLGTSSFLKRDILGDNVKLSYMLTNEIGPSEIAITDDVFRSFKSTVHVVETKSVMYNQTLYELYIIDGIGDPYNISC